MFGCNENFQKCHGLFCMFRLPLVTIDGICSVAGAKTLDDRLHVGYVLFIAPKSVPRMSEVDDEDSVVVIDLAQERNSYKKLAVANVEDAVNILEIEDLEQDSSHLALYACPEINGALVWTDESGARPQVNHSLPSKSMFPDLMNKRENGAKMEATVLPTKSKHSETSSYRIFNIDENLQLTEFRKAKSNDFLDRWHSDHMLTSYGRARSSASCTPPSRQSQDSAKMTRIKDNLYLGNLEAACDVILLQSNAISHVLSVDSVPLPRKINAMLPKLQFLHLQVTDLPEEDILTHLIKAIHFIDSAVDHGGSVLVHCYRGRSRSATVVVAYLMHKHCFKLKKALSLVKKKRNFIKPHASFLAQLQIFQDMDYQLDKKNIQYKMFRLNCAAEKMRKAKILYRDSLEQILDDDPFGGPPGSSSAALAAANRNKYPMIYKCRRCRRILATAFNMLPHVSGHDTSWMDTRWSGLNEEDVLDDAVSHSGMGVCSQSVFIMPIKWMESEIKHNLAGRLFCPNCQSKIGYYSWVKGQKCNGCGANVHPCFELDMTEIIFRTRNRYLKSSTSREAILV